MPAPEPRAWHGTVYRHLPVGSPFGPLATHLCGRSRENRWNHPGEPTLGFASDPALLAREFRRHIALDRDPALASAYRPRQVYQVELRLQSVFDLTDPATLAALGIEHAPACFADRALARATAGFLRHTRHADGLRVPSLVAPDDSAQWMLLVFLDQLSEPLDAAVQRVTTLETFQFDELGTTETAP